METVGNYAGTDEEWKRVLKENFDQWIEWVSRRGHVEATEKDPPDLESFFQELCILRTEFRKNARRSHETFVRFGETLEKFERLTQSILSRFSELADQKEGEEILSKKRIYLPFVDLFERLKRIESRMAESPRRRLFFRRRTLSQRALRGLKESFEILTSHFETLLSSEGISPVETVGRPFDPRLMTAVEVEKTPSVPPGTVVEEFSRGYLFQGHPLKLAEVKVAKEK